MAALSYIIGNAAGGVFLVGALLHGDPVSVVLCEANGQPVILGKALQRQPLATLRTLQVLLQASGGQSAVQG